MCIMYMYLMIRYIDLLTLTEHKWRERYNQLICSIEIFCQLIVHNPQELFSIIGINEFVRNNTRDFVNPEPSKGSFVFDSARVTTKQSLEYSGDILGDNNKIRIKTDSTRELVRKQWISVISIWINILNVNQPIISL